MHGGSSARTPWIGLSDPGPRADSDLGRTLRRLTHAFHFSILRPRQSRFPVASSSWRSCSVLDRVADEIAEQLVHPIRSHTPVKSPAHPRSEAGITPSSR